MRPTFSALVFGLGLGCAGEDLAVAPASLVIQRVAPDTGSAGSPEDEDGYVDPNAPLDGLHDDVGSGDAVLVDASTSDGSQGDEDTGSETPPDAGPPAPDIDGPDTGWVPEWVENADPSVKGCLETFPAICDKVNECASEQPLLGILGGFCPTLFDAINPILTLGCDQIGGLLEQAVPGGIPLVGDLGDLIPKLLKGCVENFQCDPAYLQEFGATLAEIVAMFQNQGAAGGGGGIEDALPALLKLADQCGGLGVLFPDLPFFGGGE